MKKLPALFLVLILLFSTCFAEGLDYSSMTDAQLHDIVDAARNELAKRELTTAGNTVLLDQDGVQVYLTGDYTITGSSKYLVLDVVVINDSDKNISVSIDSDCSINGWAVSTMGCGETPAGKKKRAELSFKLSDAGISTYEEIEDIEMTLYLYDMDKWETVSRTETITLHPNAK